MRMLHCSKIGARAPSRHPLGGGLSATWIKALILSAGCDPPKSANGGASRLGGVRVKAKEIGAKKAVGLSLLAP
ncbi:MAG: hypothetical protein AAF909_15960, partial [Pseudomonadota bacterium]